MKTLAVALEAFGILSSPTKNILLTAKYSGGGSFQKLQLSHVVPLQLLGFLVRMLGGRGPQIANQHSQGYFSQSVLGQGTYFLHSLTVLDGPRPQDLTLFEGAISTTEFRPPPPIPENLRENKLSAENVP